MASGDTKTEALLNILGNGGDASDYRGCCNTKTQSYILDAIDRVQDVEDEVEELKNNPDVVDIVNTYADLQAYDKSTLTDKDIIRVLEDSTHNNKSTYYRYSVSTDSFTYVGEAGGGVNVVQTTGTSTTDVMSQNAVTSMVFADPADKYSVQIGSQTAGNSPNHSVAIGNSTRVSTESVVIGENALTNGANQIAIGRGAGVYNANARGCIALGDQTTIDGSEHGVMSIAPSSTSYGYNSTNYRLLTGLYDGQSAHDAATVGQLNGRVLQNAGAPTTSTVGTVGQLLEDTTNGKLYQCTAIDTTDPNNPSYTWSEVGAGGGGPIVVQTTGASTTDVMSQDAATKLIYPDITNYPNRIGINNATLYSNGCAINGTVGASSGSSIAIGGSSGSIASIGGNGSAIQGVAIGADAGVGRGGDSASIGTNAYCNSGQNDGRNVAIGFNTYCGNGDHTDSVALGANAKTTRRGEVNIGTGTANLGFNSTKYRVIGGVHDGQDAHDAATLAQGNTLATSAPTTSTIGVLGQLYTDTTGMHTYQLTSIDTTDPNNPSYTWTQRW